MADEFDSIEECCDELIGSFECWVSNIETSKSATGEVDKRESCEAFLLCELDFKTAAVHFAEKFPASPLVNQLALLSVSMRILDPGTAKRRWPEICLAIIDARLKSAGCGVARSVPITELQQITFRIPPDKRTKPLTKRKVAELLGRQGDPGRAVEWLNACIRDGTIRFERVSRQSGFYHVEDFPEKVLAKIKPN